MNRNILSEINRYREIVGLPLIDEQRRKDPYKGELRGVQGRPDAGNTSIPIWDRRGGKIAYETLARDANGTPYMAMNIKYDDGIYALNSTSRASKVQPKVETTPAEVKPIFMPAFDLTGGRLQYNDNCVLPIVNEGRAKEEFDKIVNSFIKYIKNGGFEKIESITIQGSADSGAPSTSGNDHVKAGYSKPFNGETDKYKMNQFLADERAKQYGLLVSNTVKEATGKDISSKYKYLKGENFYGQSNPEGGRVGERKIDFIVNAPVLKIADKKEVIPGSTKITDVDRSHKPVDITIHMPDGSVNVLEGVGIVSTSGDKQEYTLSGFPEDSEKLNNVMIPLRPGRYDSKIEGNQLMVNGKLYCTFKPISEFHGNLGDFSDKAEHFCKVTKQAGREQGIRRVETTTHFLIPEDSLYYPKIV